MRYFLVRLLFAGVIVAVAAGPGRQMAPKVYAQTAVAQPARAPVLAAAIVPPPPPAPQLASLVGTYCVTCHNDKVKTAGLSLQALQSLDQRDMPAHADVWEKVMRKVKSGDMPPTTVRVRPDGQTSAAFATYVESVLDWSATAHPNPGRAPVHRLNRAEYSNAIRDLLAVDVRPGEWLPVDDSGYGFDNIAAVLSTSPALLDRYLSAARKVSQLAVGDLTLKPAEDIYDAKRDLLKGVRNEQLNDDLPFDSRAGMSVQHYFPVDGEYVFKVRFLGVLAGTDEAAADPYQVRVPVKAGLHTIGVTSPRENFKTEAEAPGGRGGGRAAGPQLPAPVDLRVNGARVKRFDVVGLTPNINK
ncbi:MAG: DUF1587 domain-containing protein, partial [Vicinamibacterales bacterium]|nr:DUF1587 domain-containing protein [Vicinamibacterales bacterium]